MESSWLLGGRRRRSATPAGIEPVDPEAIPDEWIGLPAVIPVLTPWLRRSLETAAGRRGFATLNGIPWWYFQGMPGPHHNHRLRSLDPHGIIWQHIEAERILACVAYPAADKPEPGVVRLVASGRFPLGELDGTESSGVRELFDVFEEAGLPSRILDDVRSEIWLKAWGSLSFNPISALTGATLQQICEDPEGRSAGRSAHARSRSRGP